jgi:hypothetical protein
VGHCFDRQSFHLRVLFEPIIPLLSTDRHALCPAAQIQPFASREVELGLVWAPVLHPRLEIDGKLLQHLPDLTKMLCKVDSLRPHSYGHGDSAARPDVFGKAWLAFLKIWQDAIVQQKVPHINVDVRKVGVAPNHVSEFQRSQLGCQKTSQQRPNLAQRRPVHV